MSDQPTPFVAAAIGTINHRPTSILDLGCGYGRHALWLAGLGHSVTAFDIDEQRVLALVRGAPKGSGSVYPVVGDGARDLPFRASSYDLVLVVHFVPKGLIELVGPLVRPDGHLLVETFGGLGENWRDLPAPGRFRAELSAAFDLLDYRERSVGPSKREAVAVKFLGRKR